MKCFIKTSDFNTYLSLDRRLSNFTIMVGHDLDWRNNYHCHSQLSPVPMGATVLYRCNQPLQGHVVSVNKTSSGEYNMGFLVLHEVQVFGFENGEAEVFRVFHQSDIVIETSTGMKQQAPMSWASNRMWIFIHASFGLPFGMWKSSYDDAMASKHSSPISGINRSIPPTKGQYCWALMLSLLILTNCLINSPVVGGSGTMTLM